jgi:hypothetical protein
MKVPSINNIKAAFIHAATAFKVDLQHSSKTEIEDVCSKMEENALTVPCIETECYEFGWATLICKETEWRSYHADRLTAINEKTATAAAYADERRDPDDEIEYDIVTTHDPEIPALPSFDNPGKYVIIGANEKE